MKRIFSWILTVGGVALLAAGAAGYLNRSSSLHGYWLLLVIGGAATAVVGYFLGREAQIAQRTTIMLKQKQKRNYQIAVRLIVLAAAAVLGYLLIGLG